MKNPGIVIDTSVWIAALGSRFGASFRLLELVDRRRFVLNVSVPLILEYESIAKREANRLGLANEDIDDIIDYLCAVARHWSISYLWRPGLTDPGDEMILELAVTARCSAIVTFNVRDFGDASRFGIRVLRPGALLKEIGELP
jgi:putative PIN family toxin of toxin-antitoxin system